MTNITMQWAGALASVASEALASTTRERRIAERTEREAYQALRAAQQAARDDANLKLTRAFAALRKLGFVARKGFMCCGGCAGAEIANLESAHIDAGGEPHHGGVFTTQQDRDFISGARPTNSVMLKFGAIDMTGKGVRGGLSTEAVGAAVVRECERAGLTVRWDGDAARCIEVVFYEKSEGGGR